MADGGERRGRDADGGEMEASWRRDGGEMEAATRVAATSGEIWIHGSHGSHMDHIIRYNLWDTS